LRQFKKMIVVGSLTLSSPFLVTKKNSGESSATDKALSIFLKPFVIAALREAEERLGQGETGSQVYPIGPDIIGKLWRLDRFETVQGEF
jgi:hypothetical protein